MQRWTRRAFMAATLTASVVAHAQTWPARPVRIIVSQTAGSAPDIICRLITDRLATSLGQNVIVDNRPGGGNVIGTQVAARAPADGYTFFFATAAALVTNPYTFKDLPYDPIKDFTGVAMIGKGPFVILVHPSVPVKTFGDLVNLDRAQPGKLSFASDGPKGFAGMLGEWLNKLAGTKIVQVPYNVNAQGLQDTVAGRVQVTIQAIGPASPFMKRGDLRTVAVSSAVRAPGYEDIPPVADTLPGFDFVGWFVLVAPTGTSPEIVTRMNREIDRVIRTPEVVSRIREFGIYPDGAATPDATSAFVRKELASWGHVVREIGIQPE